MLEKIILNPCPKCGKLPKLEIRFKRGLDGVLQHYYRFTCMKWFGLKKCTVPNYFAPDRGKGRLYGKRLAKRVWNMTISAPFFATLQNH